MSSCWPPAARFDEASGRDALFEQLVTARIIEPTSKQDAARVLAEAGVRAKLGERWP
jgi:hypothetical protein